MSDLAVPAGAGSALCWNCQQPLQVGSARCLWCGVAQQAAPTQFVMAPGGAAAGPSTVAAAPVPVVAAPAARGLPAIPVARLPRGAVSLAPVFAGTVASAAARVVAFTVDVIVVIGIAALTFALTGQFVYAALAIIELIVGLWVLEARTGLTVGNALLRLRAARDDAPYSPGIGRSFVRSLVTGVGFLVLLIGAWVVVASSGWDSAHRGRSWADRAAHTLVVKVPRRTRTVPVVSLIQPGAVPAGVVPVSGVASAVPSRPPEPQVVLAAPQVISTAARTTVIDENSASASSTGISSAAFGGVPVPVVETVAAPMARSAAPAASAAKGSDGTLLLVFDTGQREQLATPVVVNLGRNPTITDKGDKLISVKDPESTVSKNHLRLEHSRGNTWVTDGGSTNGTDLLSDEGEVTPLVAGERVLLEEGVRVRVGNRAFTISLLLPDGETP